MIQTDNNKLRINISHLRVAPIAVSADTVRLIYHQFASQSLVLVFLSTVAQYGSVSVDSVLCSGASVGAHVRPSTRFHEASHENAAVEVVQ